MSQKQTRAIYAMARELGIDNAALHEIVYHATGCTSIRLLSDDEAGKVITRLNDEIKGIAPAAPPASDAQKKKLWATMFELFRYDKNAKAMTWDDRNKRMAGLVKRVLGRDPPNPNYPLSGITKPEIAKLIKAAQKYVESAKRKTNTPSG